MGIRVKDALKLKGLETFRLAAGGGGLEGEIKTVGILEHEIASGMEKAFYEGDFVLSSLFALREDPKKLLKVVETLSDLGVRGLAIKTVYFKSVPEPVRRFADDRGFPIFLYDETVCLEDLVYSLLRALKDEEDDAYLASKIHGLLGLSLGPETVRRIAYEINGRFGDRIFVLCFLPAGNPWERATALNRGPGRQPGDRALAFGDSVILIHSAETVKPDRLLERIGLSGSWTGLGTSGGLHGIEALDEALRKALSASRVARAYGLKTLSFEASGLYRFLAPCAENVWAQAFCREILGKLKAHDQERGSEWVKTARAYILAGRDVRRTAEALHVHENTVRYRLERMRGFVCGDPAVTEFDEQLAVAVRLGILNGDL